MKPRWIDTHIHVSDFGPDGQHRGRLVDDLLEVMERSGADLRFVVSCDLPYYEAMVRDPSAIYAGNRMIYDLVRRAPGRLYGSCVINPNFLEESLRVMRLCFEEWGFVQLGEMLQYVMDFSMDSEAAEKTVRLAASYDVPVQVHVGTNWLKSSAYSCQAISHFRDVLLLADRVPEAKFILAHAIGCGPTGQYVPWGSMYLDALAASYDEFPRMFWLEIYTFHTPLLTRALREVPGDRLLAGTDWVTRVGPPFQSYGVMPGVLEGDSPFPVGVASMIGFLREAGASEEAVERIGFENARELLKLET